MSRKEDLGQAPSQYGDLIKRFDAVTGANVRLALHRLRQFSGLLSHAKAPMRQEVATSHSCEAQFKS